MSLKSDILEPDSSFHVMSWNAGMVGYITASLKNVGDTRVGDTVTDAAESLRGAAAGI